MVPIRSGAARPLLSGAGRPVAFLVSTTGWARGIRNNLGSAAYSYYFVLEALAPLLEELGTWRLVDHPESSLPFLARKAEAEGYRPVHLALNPPQDGYFTPAVPTIIFPFWEFPDLPDRDFGPDTRQNWVRVLRGAALVVTACDFTAQAFRRAGLAAPVEVVPVPLSPDHFDLPDWDPAHLWTHTCRHEVWGDTAEEEPEEPTPPAEPEPQVHPEGGPISWKRRAWGTARGAFRTVAPWLGPRMTARIVRLKHLAFYAVGRYPNGSPLPTGRPSPAHLAFAATRRLYNRFVRRWLSAEAIAAITRAKERLFRLLGRPPIVVQDPLLPASPLTLSGLVFTSIFNLGDPRKNPRDLLSAFLWAFRDRPDVTLVLKLVTNAAREHHEMGLLRQMYRALGIAHRCRVVVITDYLDDAAMAGLFRATTYYINTSHAEGACLPLQQALAGGRPGIAPAHSAMADFLDETVGFPLRSSPEPACWPHDPERRLETTWARLDWSSLCDALRTAAAVADSDPARYAAMAGAARRRMAAYASRPVALKALRSALSRLPESRGGALAWAS